MNENPIVRSLLQSWPIAEWQECTIVVAVSGGADSVALLSSILNLRPAHEGTIVAHFNHGLRGQDSDHDESFVRHLAEQNGVRFVSGHANEFLEADSLLTLRSENALRNIRYRFLMQVAKENNATWIAMGHQSDDVVETFLHHLLRGSGPRGLASIRARRKVSDGCQVIRPLLNVSRDKIEVYLRDKGLTYREDASNSSDQYTRNQIRNKLLPLLREFAARPGLDDRLFRAANLIAEEHLLIETMASEWLANHRLPIDDEDVTRIEFSIQAISATPWPIVREALTLAWKENGWPLREMNARHWIGLKELIREASKTTHRKRIQLPQGIVAVCQRGIFRISLSRPAT